MMKLYAANDSFYFSSNQTAVFEDFMKRPDWIIPMIVSSSLMIANLYITISLVHYGIKSGKWKTSQVVDVERLNAGVVYSFVVMCSIMCMFRYIATIIHINIGYDKNDGKECELVLDLAFICYALVLYSAALAWWFRQRAFYRNKMLSYDASKRVKVLSLASIIIISAGGLGYSLFAVIPNNYKPSKQGCLYSPEKWLKVSYSIYVSIFLVVAELMLLYLFFYPLKEKNSKPHWSKKQVSNNNRLYSTPPPMNDCNESDKCRNGSKFIPKLRKSSVVSNSPSSAGIRLIMKKTLIFVALTLTVDVFAQLFSKYVSPTAANKRLHAMVFDITAFLNLFCLTLSFATYKKILTSPFYKHPY